MATNQYSFAEACAMLKIAPATLRRRIQSGEVHAERVVRPQGYSWTVYLERVPDRRDVSDVASRLQGDDPSTTWQQQASGDVSRSIDVVDGQQLALVLAPLVEASVNAAVAPLRAELADVRALLSERDQEIGQLRTVLAHVMAEKDARSAQPKGAPWWAVWRWAAL